MYSKYVSRQCLRRHLCLLASLAIGLELVGAIVLWPRAHAIGRVEASVVAPAASGGAFVFRFDPALHAFEVFTIPTTGAVPDGIAVFERSGATVVWFAESAADQIGRLIYTDTAHYTLREYELPAGSRPLNVAVDGAGRAWFTENGRNRIGRIDGATGALDEFVISTTNVAPIDLAIAPDGSVWFTERNTDLIGQLVVNTPSNYAVHEFSIGLSDAGLSGILVEGNDKIWAALSNQNKIARLQPSVPQVDRSPPLVPPPAYPFRLALDGSRMWFTELQGNHISLFYGTTLEFGLRYAVPTAGSYPYDLDVDSTRAVWFSQQRGGKVGRLVVTTTATFTEFPVPLPQACVQGLAVDSSDVIWFAAYRASIIYIPLTMRSWADGD